MPRPIPIELLAPASSLEVGRVALSAGADAVYIGAPQFGARRAASVSLPDIATLCREAHYYGAKVYVALNTILTDEELPVAVSLAHQLYEIGADALIVQDMGLLRQELPPIPLHASTQCHNNSLAKLQMMETLGFEQIVLPREWSTADMAAIKGQVGVRLEAFIHGALCVSYSGRCFISEACDGRSANRGACAQYCRMSYDLEDAAGKKIRTNQHLLSLRDLNRTEIIEEMLDAGISSLKIEGRLKGADYVRNVTAHYRRLLDKIIAHRPEEYVRSSWGGVKTAFEPKVEASFSRRFTSYNTPLHRPIPVESITPYTNKSVGEQIGRLLRCREREVHVRLSRDDIELANGDGLLFVSADERETVGAQINQVLPLANKARSYSLRLSQPIVMGEGATVFRNLNHKMSQILFRADASERKVPITMECLATSEGIALHGGLSDAPYITASVCRDMKLEPAQRDNDDHLRRVLGKLGDTPYSLAELSLRTAGLYLPPSVLTEMRRELVRMLSEASDRYYRDLRARSGAELLTKRRSFLEYEDPTRAERYELPSDLPFTYNVANQSAESLYRMLGVEGDIQPALEVKPMEEGAIPVMFTRHCLLHQVGYCTREGRKAPFPLPLYLVRGNQRFRVETDCRKCQMTLYLIKS